MDSIWGSWVYLFARQVQDSQTDRLECWKAPMLQLASAPGNLMDRPPRGNGLLEKMRLIEVEYFCLLIGVQKLYRHCPSLA